MGFTKTLFERKGALDSEKTHRKYSINRIVFYNAHLDQESLKVEFYFYSGTLAKAHKIVRVLGPVYTFVQTLPNPFLPSGYFRRLKTL
jgi:hypothetical protein